MSASPSRENDREMNGRFARFGWKIITDWSFSLSALIAYYLLISLLPLILSIFAVVSLIFGDNGKFQTQMRDRLVKSFPEQGLTDVLDALLNSLSRQAGLVFIISFLVALFTGSRLFVGLDDVLTIIYRIRERKILEQNILAIKMIVAFVAIMPFIIIFSSIPALMERQESFYQFITILLGGLCAFAFFQLIYLILPKRRMHWRNTYVEISREDVFSDAFIPLDGVGLYSQRCRSSFFSCSSQSTFTNSWRIMLVNWVSLSLLYSSSTPLV